MLVSCVVPLTGRGTFVVRIIINIVFKLVIVGDGTIVIIIFFVVVISKFDTIDSSTCVILFGSQGKMCVQLVLKFAFSHLSEMQDIAVYIPHNIKKKNNNMTTKATITATPTTLPT